MIAPACFIISYFLTRLNGKVSVFGAEMNNPVLFYVNAIIGSMGIMAMALTLKDIGNERIAQISTSSICVVLTHMVFVTHVREWKDYLQLSNIEIFLFYTVATVIIYITCYYIYIIINKICPWVFGRR